VRSSSSLLSNLFFSSFWISFFIILTWLTL
jgi:hypothetical protein